MTKPEPGVRTGQGQGMRVGLGSEDWPQSPDQGVKTEVRESGIQARQGKRRAMARGEGRKWSLRG